MREIKEWMLAHLNEFRTGPSNGYGVNVSALVYAWGKANVTFHELELDGADHIAWAIAEEVARLDDLKTALQEGWLQADDRSAICNYCGADAEYVRCENRKGYVAKHESDCLMVKYADLVKA